MTWEEYEAGVARYVAAHEPDSEVGAGFLKDFYEL